MQLRLIIALGADSTSKNRKRCIHWKGGDKVQQYKVKVGVREEKYNHPKDVNLVAMPKRFYFIITVIIL